mmetsp:Transcript_15922/g.34591  ORF Transcript_15922/g.34591 Transcript_15922/m.34591 type:complete len:113 (+) Transcript_15922:258-596(+)
MPCASSCLCPLQTICTFLLTAPRKECSTQDNTSHDTPARRQYSYLYLILNIARVHEYYEHINVAIINVPNTNPGLYALNSAGNRPTDLGTVRSLLGSNLPRAIPINGGILQR